MKKLQVLLIALSMGICISACRHGKHITIVSSDNDHVNLRIEYSGRIIFSDDKSSILNISRGGYFKYERNGEKIEAEQTKKGIIYEVNGTNETTKLDADGQRLLKEAIREVAKEQAKHQG